VAAGLAVFAAGAAAAAGLAATFLTGYFEKNKNKKLSYEIEK
jgi:hypothetical protein